MLTQRQLFLKHVAQTSDAPLLLEVNKAEGMYIYSPNGEKWLDLISGISVSNLGHCHPRIVKAVTEQAKDFMHLMVYGEYVHYPQVKLSSLLVEQLPDHLNSVYLVNSGTEATEGALKLAKRYTGRTELVGFNKSYHGSTHGSLSLLGDEYFRQAYRPLLPDVRHLDYNQVDQLEQITERTACVICEPVQAESGVTPPDACFLLALRERCTQVGALLIFDEIQTGYGRTGSLFAFQAVEVEPDILLLAKGMGGGMPIGAFIASAEMMTVFQDNPVLGHITTFGGHPVSSAAALATLECLLEEPHLINGVGEKAALFKSLLRHPSIKAVRNKGLMMALEFEDYDFNKKVIDNCIANGVITDWFLFAPNCLRIAPPLIITEEQIRSACAVILKAIEGASA